MAAELTPPRLSRLEELCDPDSYEILDLIVTYLGIGNSLVLRLVSKACNDRVNYCLQRTPSKADTQLQRFVRSPKTLRSQLGEQNGLVAGPFALDFFELGKHDVSSLDILVAEGLQSDCMLRYIKDVEGYEDKGEGKNYMNRSCTLFSNLDRPGKILRIMKTNGYPILTILRLSFNTAILNFITWNKAYSVFPRATLIHHKCHLLGSSTNDLGPLLRDQTLLGWTNRDIVWPDLYPQAHIGVGKGLRRIGDGRSCIIPLDVCGVQQAPISDAVIEHAQFELCTKKAQAQPQQPIFSQQPRPPQLFSENELEKGQFSVLARVLRSPALRHPYVLADPSWSEFINDRLKRWIWLECLKINTNERPESFNGDRPPNYSEVALPSDFQQPKGWDYADDQIATWYAEWEHSRKVAISQARNHNSIFGSAQPKV